MRCIVYVERFPRARFIRSRSLTRWVSRVSCLIPIDSIHRETKHSWSFGSKRKLLLLSISEKAALADKVGHLRWHHFIPALIPAGDALKDVAGKDRQIFRVVIIELDEAAAADQVIVERLQLGFHLE